jgi:hypothetical protein
MLVIARPPNLVVGQLPEIKRELPTPPSKSIQFFPISVLVNTIGARFAFIERIPQDFSDVLLIVVTQDAKK